MRRRLLQSCFSLVERQETPSGALTSFNRAFSNDKSDAGSRYKPPPSSSNRRTESDFEAQMERTMTPWVRTVISGAELMRNPKYNKGLAFSPEERDKLYLRGLLPAVVLSQETQVERVMINIRSMESDLDKYQYLTSLQERNDRLFYRVLYDHIEELLPIVHMPTVGQACLKFGLMFRSIPRGLFLTANDRGRMLEAIKNWPERRVRCIVATDGERVLGMGDLGVQGMGIAVSKLAMYTACAGIPPSACLPVHIDVGCDNDVLGGSPFYVGLRRKRIRGDEYYDLMDEFVTAVKRRFGNRTLIHFEDLRHSTSAKLLAQHRQASCTFNDDLQVFPAVVLSAFLSALPTTERKLSEHNFMFVGDGTSSTELAEAFSSYISRKTGEPAAFVRQRMFLYDSQGLVTRGRADSLSDEALLYAHSVEGRETLAAAVEAIKPSVLIGLTSFEPARGAEAASSSSPSTSGPVASFPPPPRADHAPPIPFTEAVCKEMAANHRRPVIFSLSLPEPEIVPEHVYRWTGGRALFLGRQRLNTRVRHPSGHDMIPSTALSAYLFPGVALGSLISGAVRLKDDMFTAAAEVLTSMVGEEDKAVGALLPRMKHIRNISAHIAARVAQIAYDDGVATELPRPPSLLQTANLYMYQPTYRRMR